jgi:hypothetical protein
MGRPQAVQSPISSECLTCWQEAQVRGDEGTEVDGTAQFSMIRLQRRIHSRLSANIHALRIDVNTYLCHIRYVSVSRLSLYSLKRPIEVNTDGRIRCLLPGQYDKAR